MHLYLSNKIENKVLEKLALQGINHTKRLCVALKDKRIKVNADNLQIILQSLDRAGYLDLQYKKYKILVLTSVHFNSFLYLWDKLDSNKQKIAAKAVVKHASNIIAIQHVIDNTNEEALLSYLLNRDSLYFKFALSTYGDLVDLSKANHCNLVEHFNNNHVIDYLIKSGTASYYALILITYGRDVSKLFARSDWPGLTETELLSTKDRFNDILLLHIHYMKPLTPTLNLYNAVVCSSNLELCYFFFDFCVENRLYTRLQNRLDIISIPIPEEKRFVENCFQLGLVKKAKALSWCVSRRLLLLKDQLLQELLFEICKWMITPY